jgi:hypothetical protein
MLREANVCRAAAAFFRLGAPISQISGLVESLSGAFRVGLMISRARGPLHISVTRTAPISVAQTRTKMTTQTHNDNNTTHATKRKSGRPAFSENGSTVWEWQTATGVFERQISDEKLHELTSPGLQIADDSMFGPRKYEGLWIHDAHRPVRSVPVPRAHIEPRRATHPFRELLRKLSWG